MPYFPNYLSLASPFQLSSGLNFFNTMEYQMRHMDRLFGELKRRGATTFRGDRGTPTRKYRDRMTELLGDSLWTIGNLCDVEVLLLQSPGRADAAAADVDGKRRSKEASQYPLSGLPDLRDKRGSVVPKKETRVVAKLGGLAVAGVGPGPFHQPAAVRRHHQARPFRATVVSTSTSTAAIENGTRAWPFRTADPNVGDRRDDRLRGLLGRQTWARNR